MKDKNIIDSYLKEMQEDELFYNIYAKTNDIMQYYKQRIFTCITSNTDMLNEGINQINRERYEEIRLIINAYWYFFNFNKEIDQEFNQYVGPAASIKGKSLSIHWRYYCDSISPHSMHIKKGTRPGYPRYRKDAFDNYAGWELFLANQTEDLFAEYRKIWSILNEIDKNITILNKLINNRSISIKY